jgi:peptide/nickel transport system substrate-binding protein
MKRFPVRRVATVGLAAAVAGAMLAGCSQPAAPGDTELSIRIPFAPGTWNPLDASYLGSHTAVAQAVYEPLLRYTEDGELVPWLAESYEMSADSRTLTLDLRDGVDFTDGVPFDAETVAASLDRIFHPLEGENTGGRLVDGWHPEVEAVDDDTIEITSDRPMRGEWFINFGNLGIVSPEALESPESLAQDSAGTGPYLIDEIVPDSSVSFVRNPEYWNPDAFPFDTVTMTVYDDDVAALNALQGGQLDASYVLDLALANGAVAQGGLELNTGVGLSPSIYFTDRAGEALPPLADVRVRQAINMAFDREGINDSLNFGLGEVSSQPFLPWEAAYVEGGDDRYPFDVEAAEELMAEAGYADGFDLTIASVPGFTDFYEPALQNALAQIDITVIYDVVQLADFGTLFFDKWQNLYYPVVAYPMAVGATRYEWIQLYFGGFPEPEAAEFYDRMSNGSNEEAEQAEKEFGEYMLDNAWFAPFSVPPAVVVSREGLTVEVGLSAIDGNSQWTPFWGYALAD